MITSDKDTELPVYRGGWIDFGKWLFGGDEAEEDLWNPEDDSFDESDCPIVGKNLRACLISSDQLEARKRQEQEARWLLTQPGRDKEKSI